MQIMAITQIIQEHPGYYWQWEGDQWQLKWEPVHCWYSPPCMHPNVLRYDLHVPLELRDKIGVLIGHKGKNFIRITFQTGCYYIFYLSVDNKIEVWGMKDDVDKAVGKLRALMTRVAQDN